MVFFAFFLFSQAVLANPFSEGKCAAFLEEEGNRTQIAAAVAASGHTGEEAEHLRLALSAMRMARIQLEWLSSLWRDLDDALMSDSPKTFLPNRLIDLGNFGLRPNSSSERMENINELIFYLQEFCAYLTKFWEAQVFFSAPAPKKPTSAKHPIYLKASANWAAVQGASLALQDSVEFPQGESENPKTDQVIAAYISMLQVESFGAAQERKKPETAIDMLNKPLVHHLSPAKSEAFIRLAESLIVDGKIPVAFQDFLRGYLKFLQENSLPVVHLSTQEDPMDFLRQLRITFTE